MGKLYYISNNLQWIAEALTHNWTKFVQIADLLKRWISLNQISRNIEKTNNVFATLIQLPTFHEGGQRIVKQTSKKKIRKK